MAEIPFNVSARTAKLIGLENFSNEEGAIIELVKNTYDADAKNCILIFDLVFNEIVVKEGSKKTLDKENSAIYIIDNGDGMTGEVISNQWMTIGTDDKLYKHLTDNGRVKTGSKGIGRFALNRLGLRTELLTVSKKSEEGYSWQVNWNDFDKSGVTVSQVKAELNNIPNLNLKKEVSSNFQEVNNLQELLKSINFNTGTIIKICNLTDNWDYQQLTKLFDNLDMLLPPKEQSDFHIHLFSASDPATLGKVKGAYYDDFDYKIEANYHDDENRTLQVKVTRNELDINMLESKYKAVFGYEEMKNSPYDLDSFKSKTITIDTSLNAILSSDIEDELINKIGSFKFSFYYLKNTISDDKDGGRKKYPYNKFNSSNRKSWLRKFGGVKIFRDDFRIRPYGENGEDWLKLGERQAKSPGGAGQKIGGYRIRPNQIAGTINISRIYNTSLQDKSGREGIRENDVFELFKNIIVEIISLFEKDRNVIMFHLSELHKKRNKEEETKIRAQEAADRINKEQEEGGNNSKQDHTNVSVKASSSTARK